MTDGEEKAGMLVLSNRIDELHAHPMFDIDSKKLGPEDIMDVLCNNARGAIWEMGWWLWSTRRGYHLCSAIPQTQAQLYSLAGILIDAGLEIDLVHLRMGFHRWDGRRHGMRLTAREPGDDRIPEWTWPAGWKYCEMEDADSVRFLEFIYDTGNAATDLRGHPVIPIGMPKGFSERLHIIGGGA